MSWYSLPIERCNTKVPEENCYLVISKYKDDYLKLKDGKKISQKELKERKEHLAKHKTTVSQLDTGYCNLYNNKIQLDTIFDSFFSSYLEDNKNVLIYKIKPLTSNEIRNSYSCSQPKRYETTEFNVLSQLNTKEEIIDQIYKDGLLTEFLATIFDNLSYANGGHNLKLYSYFEYVKEKYPDFKISLSDIVLNLNDYQHVVRNKFKENDTSNITKDNIRYLLDNNLVEYFREYDYYTTELIVVLIKCGLYDVAYSCIKILNEYNKQNLIKSKDFDSVLRKWSTNEFVKEIIKFLDIKLSGLVLTVIEEKEYGESLTIETQMLDDIGQVKTYLIKNYDIPFEAIVDKDINSFEYCNKDESYFRFIVE